MKYTLIGRVTSTYSATFGRWLVAGPDGKPAYYGASKQDALTWIARQRKRKTKGKAA